MKTTIEFSPQEVEEILAKHLMVQHGYEADDFRFKVQEGISGDPRESSVSRFTGCSVSVKTASGDS